MITFTSAQLHTWIASFLWPLTRILGLFAIAPLFGNVSVPAGVKVWLGVMVALVIAPGVPALPAMDPMSLAGMLILVQQFVIGAAMGFAMRIAFAAIELAGEVAGLTMGFGFATFFDPQTNARSSAISQYLSLLALMLFLATNLHLVLLSLLADTFVTLPISAEPMNGAGIHHLMLWGGKIFTAGLQLALPVIAVLLLTNIALGVLTRAAPQLNLFGIGFPITLAAGLIMITLSLSFLATPLERLFSEGLAAAGRIALPARPTR